MDKLPLQNILRQLLCGAVFFASICVLLPDKVMRLMNNANIKELENFWMGCAFVISLTVGTLIYHMEKNFYSYIIQLWLGKTKCATPKSYEVEVTVVPELEKKEKAKKLSKLLPPGETMIVDDNLMIKNVGCQEPNVSILLAGYCGAILASAIILIIAAYATRSNIAHVVFFIMLIIVMLFYTFGVLVSIYKDVRRGDVVLDTRVLWLAEGGEEAGKSRSVIMRRVANWSDFIHCGQCCAFAWMLGSFCVLCYCLRYDPDNVPKVRITLGFFCSILLLFLELIADWHRYHHVLYVLNGKASNSSSNEDDKLTDSPPSSSNSKK